MEIKDDWHGKFILAALCLLINNKLRRISKEPPNSKEEYWEPLSSPINLKWKFFRFTPPPPLPSLAVLCQGRDSWTQMQFLSTFADTRTKENRKAQRLWMILIKKLNRWSQIVWETTDINMKSQYSSHIPIEFLVLSLSELKLSDF